MAIQPPSPDAPSWPSDPIWGRIAANLGLDFDDSSSKPDSDYSPGNVQAPNIFDDAVNSPAPDNGFSPDNGYLGPTLRFASVLDGSSDMGRGGPNSDAPTYYAQSGNVPQPAPKRQIPGTDVTVQPQRDGTFTAYSPTIGPKQGTRQQIAAWINAKRAPQRYNFALGDFESMDLSHEPKPQLLAGRRFVERWPTDHA